MRRVFVIIFIVGFMFFFIFLFVFVLVEIRLYVYEFIVLDMVFVVFVFYKIGDYDRVLEGCEWFMVIRMFFDFWGYVYSEEYEVKYIVMVIMVFIRGESIVNGRYKDVINSVVYWFIYKQKVDGFWDDYFDVVMVVIVLKEFLGSKYVEENMMGFEDQFREGLNRVFGWFQINELENDVERIFCDIVLEDKDDFEKFNVEGELKVYKVFVFVYFGEKVLLEGNFLLLMVVVMVFYVIGDEKYREEFFDMEYFGFWGRFYYCVFDLFDVFQISGFEEFREIVCLYFEKIFVIEEWQKVVYVYYFVFCLKELEFFENYSFFFFLVGSGSCEDKGFFWKVL